MTVFGKLKLLYSFLSKAPRAINTLAIATGLLLSLKLFFLNQIPAPISWFIDAGLVVEAVLISILASYIFYLIVVHKKHIDEQKAIDPLITELLGTVVNNINKSLEDISKASGVGLNLDSIDEASLKMAMSKIDPHSEAPLVLLPNLTKANWLQYLENQRIIIQGRTEKVISLARYVDHVTILRVCKIEYCDHFQVISQMNNNGIPVMDLSVFTIGYYKLVNECYLLRNHLRLDGDKA